MPLNKNLDIPEEERAPENNESAVAAIFGLIGLTLFILGVIIGLTIILIDIYGGFSILPFPLCFTSI